MVEDTHAAGQLVTALFQAFEHGSNSISAVPGLLKQVINENAWQEYSLPNSSVIHRYSTFEEFAEKVLRASIKALNNLCRDDPEALVLLREVTTNPHGGDHKSDNVIKSDNITLDNRGTSKSYSLDKLKRDRPDLYQKVLDGECKANAAMIQAGYRKRKIQIILEPQSTVKAIRKHFNSDQIKEIARLLKD